MGLSEKQREIIINIGKQEHLKAGQVRYLLAFGEALKVVDDSLKKIVKIHFDKIQNITDNNQPKKELE